MTNERPSQPDLLALDDPSFDGVDGRGTDVRRRTVSASEAFSRDVEAIRKDTGTLSLRNILPAQLASSRFIQQFQGPQRLRWIAILSELMISAKGSVTNGSPVDFYHKYRRIREEEETKSAAERLLFAERLADALTSSSFTHKSGPAASMWTVILCTSDEMGTAAPAVLARSHETGETQKIQLVQVLAGLRIE